MSKRIVFRGMMVFSTLMLTSMLAAQPMEGPPPPPEGEDCEVRDGQFMEKISEELNLTDEQSQQLKEMREAGRDSHKELREQMRAKHEAIKEELDRPDSDRAVLDQLADELAALHRQMIQQRIDDVLSMKEVLTPEQYSVLSEKINDRKEKRWEHFKNNRRHHWKEKDQD